MSRRPLLIVDGHNVIGARAARYGDSREESSCARERLVEDAALFAGDEWRCHVVFDGGGNPASDGAPHHALGVVVLFSPYGRSADEVVEALAARARERGDPATVVTSDAATQAAVIGGTISRMSAREFVDAVERSRQEWRRHTRAGGRRGTVESRLPEDVRRRLDRIARGGV